MKPIVYFILVLLAFPCQFFAQSDEWIAGIKEKYPEHSFVSERSKIEITFFRDDACGEVKVKEVQRHQFRSIKSVSSMQHAIYFSDRSSIDKVKLTDEYNRKIKDFTKVCGYINENGIFHSDAQYCGYGLKMESVDEIVNLYSETTYKDIRYFTKRYIHEKFPIYKKTIKVIKPDWLVLDFEQMNFGQGEIQVTSEKQEESVYTVFEGNKLAPLERVENSLPPSYLYPHTIFLPRSSTCEDGSEQSIISNNQDLYEFYRELASGMDNDLTNVRAKVKELIEGCENDSCQVQKIFEWVRDEIKYIAYEDGIAAFKPDNAQDVFFKRYGDCKGMANLTKEMLKTAGFDARLAWLGTRHIPYTRDITSLCVDNHMICVWMDDDQVNILDGTSKYQKFGKLPYGIRGKQMMIENGDSYLIHQIPDEDGGHLTSYDYSLRIEDDQLKGEGQATYSGYGKFQVQSYHEKLKQGMEEKFYKKIVTNSSINPDDIILEKTPKPVVDSDLKIDFQLASEDLVTAFGDELYISLDLNSLFHLGKVEEDREAPIDIGGKLKKRLNVSFTVPSGFSVSHLPDQLGVTNGMMAANFQFEQNDDELILRADVNYKKQIIDLSDFESWNASVDKINTFFNDQVTLTKKP